MGWFDFSNKKGVSLDVPLHEQISDRELKRNWKELAQYPSVMLKVSYRMFKGPRSGFIAVYKASGWRGKTYKSTGMSPSGAVENMDILLINARGVGALRGLEYRTEREQRQVKKKNYPHPITGQ